jgi:hypothetical protein
VVHKPLNGRQRHGLVGEDLTPFTERLVGGDQQGSAFVMGGDELEQHTGLSLFLGDVGDVVQVHAAEIPDRSRVGGGTFAFFYQSSRREYDDAWACVDFSRIPMQRLSQGKRLDLNTYQRHVRLPRQKGARRAEML